MTLIGLRCLVCEFSKEKLATFINLTLEILLQFIDLFEAGQAVQMYLCQ